MTTQTSGPVLRFTISDGWMMGSWSRGVSTDESSLMSLLVR